MQNMEDEERAVHINVFGLETLVSTPRNGSTCCVPRVRSINPINQTVLKGHLRTCYCHVCQPRWAAGGGGGRTLVGVLCV